MIAYTPEAFDLLHQGNVALARVEANGMAVDVPYLEATLKRTDKRIKKMWSRLEDNEVTRLWRKTYGRKTNLTSDEQLGHVIFDKMGFPSPGRTVKGRHKADEEALLTVDHPFIEPYFAIKKLNKAVSTNMRGILREAVNGRVHCFYNLHTTLTYRSSSDSFNFQNLPIRDPDIGLLIRQAFIPSAGRQLVEIDFSGAEVRVAASYCRDPRLIHYITDPSSDMHLDMAIECFILDPVESRKPENQKKIKPIRQEVKSFFVFAEFYGSWYKECAANLWKLVMDPAYVTHEGTTLREHLADLGITELGDDNTDRDPRPGTFEAHIQKVEKAFWSERFRIYAKWKKEWYAAYQRDTFFHTHTGFVCQGHMTRNQVNNYAIQGSSFHCLLWTMITLMGELVRRGMKTLIVGQIHDSIVADVVPSEFDEYIEIANRIIGRKLNKRMPWMVVPMKAEAGVCALGESWVMKREYKLD